MTFVYAFLLPALIAVAAQLIIEKTKIPVPVILKGGIILGAVLAFFGLMDPLTALGGFGITTHLIDLGEAVYSGMLGALSGDPAGIIVLLGIITVALSVSGIAGLMIKPKK